MYNQAYRPASDAPELHQRRLRVLAWPGPADVMTNPYISLIYEGMAERVDIESYGRWSGGRLDGVDVLHVHWPEAIFWGELNRRLGGTPAAYAGWRLHATACAVRAQGGVVAWTVHNLVPHAVLSPVQKRIWDIAFTAFRAQVDVCLHLSEDARRQALALYPDIAERHHALTPHPHFRDAYPAPPPRQIACATLELDPQNFHVGMIGAIRPGKGVLEGLQAFQKAARDDERLIIAGACPDEAYWTAIVEAASGDPRVALRPGFVSDADLAVYFGAVDACLMNFQSILNSGTVMLALSFDTPLICPGLGSLRELERQLGASWVSVFDGALTQELLRARLDAVRAAERPARAPLERFAPNAISAATLDAYAAARDLGPRS